MQHWKRPWFRWNALGLIIETAATRAASTKDRIAGTVFGRGWFLVGGRVSRYHGERPLTQMRTSTSLGVNRGHKLLFKFWIGIVSLVQMVMVRWTLLEMYRSVRFEVKWGIKLELIWYSIDINPRHFQLGSKFTDHYKSRVFFFISKCLVHQWDHH